MANLKINEESNDLDMMIDGKFVAAWDLGHLKDFEQTDNRNEPLLYLEKGVVCNMIQAAYDAGKSDGQKEVGKFLRNLMDAV